MFKSPNRRIEKKNTTIYADNKYISYLSLLRKLRYEASSPIKFLVKSIKSNIIYDSNTVIGAKDTIIFAIRCFVGCCKCILKDYFEEKKGRGIEF